MTRTNEFGQPIGPEVTDWSPRPLPQRVTLEGRYCRLEPLDASKHGDDMVAAFDGELQGPTWTYFNGLGPFADATEFRQALARQAAATDPIHFAIIDLARDQAVGSISLMRHDPTHGCIEMGWVYYSKHLKQSTAATEAQYLAMRYVFDELGYRRYEWKLDSNNIPSHKAATRLGFTFEGTFRNHMVYKDRSRDTEWFAATDGDWPRLKAAFEGWLDPSNFVDGRQVRSLESFR